MTDVTTLLKQIGNGDRDAGANLLPLVYDELRGLAAAKLRSERPEHTLQATALVHEAYLRLLGKTPDEGRWEDASHFFAAAAEAMRRILVDHARSRARIKRGRGWLRQPLEQADFSSPDKIQPENLVLLDDALSKLERQDPTAAELIQLRFFAGLTMLQAAQAMGISVRTAHRTWAYARAWLFNEIESSSS